MPIGLRFWKRSSPGHPGNNVATGGRAPDVASPIATGFQLPQGIRIYAIGDIHGQIEQLERLYGAICRDRRVRPCEQSAIVTLGDYLDRGPASREVLNMLIEISASDKLIALRGNHDTWLTELLVRPEIGPQWVELGGLATLRSYGIASSNNPRPAEWRAMSGLLREVFPGAHGQFLAELKSHVLLGDYFFAHAGVRPGVPLGLQREEDLYWIRKEFLNYEGSYGKMIVHGHTPAVLPEVRTNRINVDTGAYATGRLTAVVLEDENLFFISSAD
jgi:serine/threonine protein phosphatase 1